MCEFGFVESVVSLMQHTQHARRLVSWSDHRKYEHVPGLQDNVRIVVMRLTDRSWLLKTLLNGRWWTILHFLSAFLALPFSVVWEQV
jgi:hypothetical protein